MHRLTVLNISHKDKTRKFGYKWNYSHNLKNSISVHHNREHYNWEEKNVDQSRIK